MIRNLRAFARDMVDALPVMRRIAQLERRLDALEQRNTPRVERLFFGEPDNDRIDALAFALSAYQRQPPH